MRHSTRGLGFANDASNFIMDLKELMVDSKSKGASSDASNDSSTYGLLYTSYKDVVIGSLVKKGFTKEVAEEIVQDAFVRLLSLDKGKVPEYLKSYLYKIAHNLAIDRMRKLGSTPFRGLNSENEIDSIQNSVSHDASAEETACVKQTAEVIKVSLKELPDNCQQAFYLYKIVGLGYEDISEQMGVSSSMVRKHVLRAIRHCYERLELEHDWNRVFKKTK